MRKDREQATVLRKAGSTYADIKAKLGIPLSTLSTWFQNEPWSNAVAEEHINHAVLGSKMRFAVMNTVRGSRLKNLYEEARQDATVDFDELKYHPLFIAGIMEYRAHGDMVTNNKVSLSTSNPDSVRIFKLFLEKICTLTHIRVTLLLKEGMDEGAEILYWQEKCGLKHEYFGKSYLLKRGVPARFKLEYHGICNVIVNSAYLKSKILKWIQLLTAELRDRFDTQPGQDIDNAGIV